jgi:hypothetical protein
VTTLTARDIDDFLRTKRRREAARTAVADFFIALITEAVASLFGGLWVMLAVGIIRHDWIHQLPTLGYWRAVLLVLLLKGVFSRTPKTKKSEG